MRLPWYAKLHHLVNVAHADTKTAIPVIPAKAGIQRGPGKANAPIKTTD